MLKHRNRRRFGAPHVSMDCRVKPGKDVTGTVQLHPNSG
jgi:hypothetical protein